LQKLHSSTANCCYLYELKQKRNTSSSLHKLCTQSSQSADC